MTVPAVLVTGPARGLVGGQARHMELLAHVSTRLGFQLLRVEIGRRAGEMGAARLAIRICRDYVEFARQLRRALRAGSPVVVHVNSSVQYASLLRDLGFLVIARAFRPRVLLLQVHGSELSDESDGRRLLRGLARIVFAVAGRTVVLSAVQAQAIGGPAIDSIVVPNTISLQEAVPRPPARGRPVRLLYLARMVAAKGVLTCLDAAALLRDQGVSFELTLAGDGPLLSGLQERVTVAGLDRLVRVLGPVAPDRVRPLLASSDLLWSPSTYAEGQPYALIEALEAGVPVLATRANAAMAEMIAESSGAILPVPQDPKALAAVTADLARRPDELERLQACAREVAERRYSLESALPLWSVAWSADARPAHGPDVAVGA